MLSNSYVRLHEVAIILVTKTGTLNPGRHIIGGFGRPTWVLERERGKKRDAETKGDNIV